MMAFIVFCGFIATVILAYKTMKHDTATASLGDAIESKKETKGVHRWITSLKH